MNPKNRSLAKQICKSGVSLLLAVQAVSSLMNNPWMNAYSDETNYANFHSAAEARAAAERNIAMAAAAGATATTSVLTADEFSGVNDTPDPRPVATPVRLETHAVEGDRNRESLPLEPQHQVTSPSFNALGGPLVALGDDSLDEVRGGFEIDTNLKYSFGIERAVFINGELVAHTTLNLKDLDQVAGRGDISQLATQELPAGTVNVVQNGAGNKFMAQVGPDAVGTVIQNSLNNQSIQNVTTINAAVNSAQVFKAMSVQSAIHSGIVDSLRR